MAEAMAVAGLVVSVAGGIYQGIQASNQADAQAKAMNARAAQERTQAVQEQAQAQQRAIAEHRKMDLVMSAERAAAASSGAGASDPSVLTNEGRILAQGGYNFDSAIYGGNTRAAGLNTQASFDDYQADQTRAGGQSRMIGGIVSTLGSGLAQGSTLYSKYYA